MEVGTSISSQSLLVLNSICVFHRHCWISLESLTFLSWTVSSPRCILVPVERRLVNPLSSWISFVPKRVHHLPLYIATTGSASSDTIPRQSRCLDTSSGHHGKIIISANKSVLDFCLNANRGCATDSQLTSVHRLADTREACQHSMENTSGGTTTGCVWISILRSISNSALSRCP